MSMMFPITLAIGREGDCAGQPYPAGESPHGGSESSLMLRRGYSYSLGVTNSGNSIWGYCLSATNTIWKRAPDSTKKVEWRGAGGICQTYRGGYFFALPGVKDANDYLGSDYCGFNVFRRIRRLRRTRRSALMRRLRVLSCLQSVRVGRPIRRSRRIRQAFTSTANPAETHSFFHHCHHSVIFPVETNVLKWCFMVKYK